jgi:outer membrane protein assembly factor BamE (lipoprotein component of BamABCDE complex)
MGFSEGARVILKEHLPTFHNHKGAKTKMKKFVVLACLTISLGLTGCTVQQGAKVESTDISFIQKGQTTKDEVIQKLGKPTSVSVDSGGKETLIWDYYKHTTDAKSFIPFAGLFIGSTQMEGSTFTVFLDKKYRVTDYQISNSRSEGRVGQ